MLGKCLCNDSASIYICIPARELYCPIIIKTNPLISLLLLSYIGLKLGLETEHLNPLTHSKPRKANKVRVIREYYGVSARTNESPVMGQVFKPNPQFVYPTRK